MHGPTPEPGYDLDADLRRREAQHWDRPLQRLLNAHPIPRRGLQHDCHDRVRARLVWELDGEEVVETLAFAWTPRLVCVEVDSRRYGVGGAWLAPADVERVHPRG
ncbi:hypothetical protein [Isoptericola sp. NPDC056134]|uniref:hypothetical protein n=1 Tax=Isoptericola sp. NPDC056134 TaxID=3345723 RepID=UPI0035EE0F24